MSIFEALLFIVLFLLVIFHFYYNYYYLKTRTKWKKNSTPTNWPLFGMLPGLIPNIHHLFDYVTDILEENQGTLEIKGPWFSGYDVLLTSDPANVHHVLTKNFSNYQKGDEFREKLDIMGDGSVSVDSEIWEFHRKTIKSLMNNVAFYRLLEKTIWTKVEKALLPFLEHFSKQGAEVDLEDMLRSFNLDSTSKLLLDHDPCSLSIDLPHVPCKSALIDSLEAIAYRYILPFSIWKLQRRLQIGLEKKLTKSWQDFDEFIYPCISVKQEELSRSKYLSEKEGQDYDLGIAFLKAYDGTSNDPNKFMRDTFLSLIFAGVDTSAATLTWLFWLLSKNPSAEAKIVEEIHTKVMRDEKEKTMRFFSVEESRELVYLHAALCETLRLFPPVSLQIRSSTKSDVLPSGHQIDPNKKVVISFYSMARMETIWGNDCLEFKPERWITTRGTIKHEPSFKFTAFNAGPRTCIGKEMAFIQMKMVASSIIYNYHVRVVEGHPVLPSPSLIIHTKYGLKIKLISRRNMS